MNAHQGSIATVAFSPDEQKLASAGEEGTVALWDTSKPGKPSRVLKGHQGSVLGLAFSPDGHTVASARRPDGPVLLWDTRSAAKPLTLKGYKGYAPSVAFSPETGDTVAAAAGRSVLLWDVRTPDRSPGA